MLFHIEVAVKFRSVRESYKKKKKKEIKNVSSLSPLEKHLLWRSIFPGDLTACI